MKYILIIVFAIVNLSAKGQLAVINDPDGYTNIREERNKDSRIIGRLFDGDIFLYSFDSEDGKMDWVAVFYSAFISELEPYKQEYYKNKGAISDTIYDQGFIHKSRIFPIDSLKPLLKRENKNLSSNELFLKNDSIQLRVSTSPFIPEQHVIKRDKGGFVEMIDNKRPRGVDGGLPKIELRSLSLRINGIEIKIPKDAYIDLYEPGIKSLNVFKDLNGNLYIYMPFSSDGAGAYSAAWLIKNKQFIRRYVDAL